MSTHQQAVICPPRQEQLYSIQPHPAVCRLGFTLELPPNSYNYSRKLTTQQILAAGPQSGSGFNSQIGAFHARDPHIPSEDILNRLETTQGMIYGSIIPVQCPCKRICRNPP